MDGLFQNYKETGIISKEYEMIDTLKNGIYTEYYDNGRKSFQTTYVLGKHSGMDYFFNKNGDTTQYGLFKDGHNKFPFKCWLKNGNTLSGKYMNHEGTRVEWLWTDKDGNKLKSKIVYSKQRKFEVPE